MGGAVVVLAVNIAVAALFAAGYAIVAFAVPGQRAALGFAASYMIGLVAPAADFVAPFVAAPATTEWLSYGGFLAALLSISITFSRYHGRPAPWRAAAVLLVGGLIVRAAIWDGPSDGIADGLAYQSPFVLAAGLAVGTVLRTGAGRPLHRLLAAIYAVVAAHFLAKPFLSASYGAGRTLTNYTSTTYALLSQASTGILLLAAGLVLILLVAHKAITDSQLASETDPLSGLANRRGFDARAHTVLARAAERGRPVAVALFDLDHFKRVNDTHGHAVGDAVIARFGALLREAAPDGAVIARLGGEEFALLLDGAAAPAARRHAEAVRLAMTGAVIEGVAMPTASGGVATLAPGESLAELLRRADHACYRAKAAGRDRICAAPDPDSGPAPVAVLQPRRLGVA